MSDVFGSSRRAFLLGSLALTAACRLNKLPKYHHLLHSAGLAVDVRREPTVNTAGEQERASSGLSGLVDDATNLAKAVISIQLQRRMQQLIPKMRASAIISQVMIERFPGIGLEFAAPPAEPDTRVELRIDAYGIETRGDRDPAKYFVTFTALLYFVPRGKKIWRFRRQLRRPIADVHVSIASDSVVGNISNTAALDKLSDADLERVLVAMLSDATHLFMDQLSADLAAARAGG